VGLKAILTDKQRAAEQRDFRATRGEPEIPRGRHRRKRGGCKKAPDDQHIWEDADYLTLTVEGHRRDIEYDYKIEQCALCRKRRYLEWK